MTAEQARRAAFGGVMIGFAGTVVIGAVVGLVAGLETGPFGFLAGLILGAAVAGLVCALPVAVIAGCACWTLGRLLLHIGAGAAAGARSFVALGACLGPLLAFSAFLVAGADLVADRWPTAIVLVIAILGGAGAGALVWQHASAPVDGARFAAEGPDR